MIGSANVEHVGLHKDHHTLVQFSTEDEDDFNMVTGYLIVMRATAPKNIAKEWAKYRQQRMLTLLRVTRLLTNRSV